MDPFIRVLFWRAVNQLLTLADVLADVIFGWTFTRGTRDERELASSYYDSSAQLATVVAKANFVPNFPLPRNGVYIYRHEKYIDPRTVLENDNIILSHFTKSEAVFGVGDPGKVLNDTEAFPFQCRAIFYSCRQHIRMPISVFHKLSDEMGDPKVKVGIAVMTARSGSTLLSQIMNRVPGTRSLSEPHPIGNLWYLFRDGTIDWEELRRRLRGAIRLLAKTQSGSDVERVIMKLCPYGAPMCEIMKDEFPDATFIFCTRHPLPTLLSYRKVWSVFADSLFGKSGQTWREHGWSLSFPVKKGKYEKVRKLTQSWMQPVNYDQFTSLIYAGAFSCAKEYADIFDQIWLYEDLSGDPAKCVQTLFDNMGVKDAASVGLAAMEKESQNGIFSHKVAQDVDPAVKRAANEIHRDLDLDLDFDCSLPEFRRYLTATFPCYSSVN